MDRFDLNMAIYKAHKLGYQIGRLEESYKNYRMNLKERGEKIGDDRSKAFFDAITRYEVEMKKIYEDLELEGLPGKE